MEEQPHEERPIKVLESGSADSNTKSPVAAEKKKSWFSFGSGQKKPDNKLENGTKGIPKEPLIVVPSNSQSSPQPADKSEEKKFRLGFGSNEKKSESTVAKPPEPTVANSSTEKNSKSSKPILDKPEKKKSRFGFTHKGKKSGSTSAKPAELVIANPTVVPSNQPAGMKPIEPVVVKPTPPSSSQPPTMKPVRKKSRFGFGSKDKKSKNKPVRPTQQQVLKGVPVPTSSNNTPNRALQARQEAIQKAKKKSFFSFGSKQKKGVLQKLPQELVHVPGNKVLIPSFEDFEKTKNIAYTVRDPFQYVNLVEQDGEIVYRTIEPQLTKREKGIHKKILTAYDLLVNVGTVLIDVEDRVRFVEETYKEIIDIYNIKMTPMEYQRILYFVERDYIRYGKADSLINDRFIEDISCNGPSTPVFVYHRFFESIRTNVVFEELELNNFILRLAQLSGRHISILQPIRDAALPDGSRVNMTLGKEVTKKGSTFTIRKFRAEPISPIEIASLRTATTAMLAFLWLLVEYEQSFLISGGTASGKSIPYDEKVLVYKSGIPKLARIGELYDEVAKLKHASIVNGAHGYEVIDCDEVETAAFNSKLKVERFPVKSIVRHPADKSIFRVKTRLGRVVTTTGDHSLFTIVDGSAVEYPVSELTQGMYVAVPRTIPEPNENAVAKSVNLLQLFSEADYGMYVENVVRHARRASESIGHRETAQILGIEGRMLLSGLKKGYLAVRVSKFQKLVEKLGLTTDGELFVRPKTLRKYRIPAILPISKSLMRFMGYWTAEGLYNAGLTVFQVDEEIKKDMARSGEEAFGLRSHRNSADSMRIQFEYSVLEALFKRLFGPKGGAEAKTIPDLVLEQTNDLLAEFLRGYFTGDGYASQWIEASTKSPELAQRLLYALSRFDIIASVRPKEIKGRIYHRVSIYGQKNLKLFEQRIGFLNSRNRANLTQSANREIAPHTNVDTIPGISGLLKRALLFKTGNARKQLWSDWHSYWAPNTVKNIGRQTLLSYLEATEAEGETMEKLLTLAYSDIFWDEIESIEHVDYNGEYVYDLEVPGAQNFVGGEGGVFLHNTTLLNAISMLIRPENKIVSVEDTPEINLAHPNWIQAVTRVGFGESGGGGGISGISGLSGVSTRGKSAGDITLYDLLIAALRQRPDYIIVGEVRGEEAYTLFQAISVGHAAMGTVHAASMVELIARIESMPMNVPRVLVANLDIVIFLAAIRRGEEKVRRVREIVEILGIDPGTKELITNTVFKWDPITDTVEYLGRSFIVEKISKSFGISKEGLEQEIEKRRAMLDDLKSRGIVNYKEVTEAVRQYYLEREAIQVELNADRKLREKGSVEGDAMRNL